MLAALLAMVLASPAAAGVELSEFHGPQAVVVTAEAANRWQQGSYEVWVLRGHCRIAQGFTTTRSDEAVLWIDRAEDGSQQPSKVIAYLEGRVVVQSMLGGKPVKLTDKSWLGRLFTSGAVEVRAGQIAGRPDVLPAVYQHGMDCRRPASPDVMRRAGVEQTLYVAPQPASATVPPGTRRFRIFPRGDVPLQLQWIPGRKRNEWVAIGDLGVNFIVDGIGRAGPIDVGSVDVSADRIVVWTRSQGQPEQSDSRTRRRRWKSTWRATSSSGRAIG